MGLALFTNYLTGAVDAVLSLIHDKSFGKMQMSKLKVIIEFMRCITIQNVLEQPMALITSAQWHSYRVSIST
jgi:hypothetical protein